MIRLLHLIVVAAYLALPALMLGRAIFLWRRKGRRLAMRRLWVSALGGLAMGLMLCSVFSIVMRGRIMLTQVIYAAYFATSLLLLLKGFDLLLWRLARWGLQLGRGGGPRWWFGARASLALVLRAAMLFGVGLPYVLASALTYRPKVASDQNPQTMFNWSFDRIAFSSTDGMSLAGWWIPAGNNSSKTVILCHGLAGGKGNQLFLTRGLHPAGYNILAFDFRAHGESAGQFTSFGDLERRDVLGAVRWLQMNHPQACRKVVGLGVSTGAAALISAAADPGPQGQNIDAIAVYSPFDRLDAVAMSITRDYIPAPFSWLIEHIGLPLASIQSGTDLCSYSPAQDVKQLWPRPILVIHGLNDEVIHFDRGEALYDSALQPKEYNWIERGGHGDVLENPGAARLIRRYFDGAGRIL